MFARLSLFFITVISGIYIHAADIAPISVQSFKVQKYEFHEKFTAIGQCIRAESRDYYSTKAGIVDKITTKQGARVLQGEIIIAIDSDMADSNLEYSKANVQSAKLTYGRLKSLFDKKFVSKEQLEDAKVNFEKAEADYSNTLKTYNDSIIKAPFDGTVGVVNATIGNNIKVGDYLFSIITEKEALVFIELPETLHGKITQDTEILLSDSNGNKSPGRVAFITPYLSDKGTITIKVEATADNKFIHGSYLSVEFIINKHKANGILQQSILKNDTGNFVYKIDEDMTAKQLYLDLGIRTNEMIEVLSNNLKENDLVVSEGLTKLQDGVKVKIEVEK